jgi:hypothetical protein
MKFFSLPAIVLSAVFAVAATTASNDNEPIQVAIASRSRAANAITTDKIRIETELEDEVSVLLSAAPENDLAAGCSFRSSFTSL